jgi:hypothetical protein
LVGVLLWPLLSLALDRLRLSAGVG